MASRFFIVIFFIFFAPSPLFAVDQDIVINEIAAHESSDYEWIEIYNRGNEPVDITGWKFYEAGVNHKLTAYRGDFIIEPREYAVIANKADNVEVKHPSLTGTLIDSSWGTLAEKGEEVGLKNASGDIVELFTYIEAKKTSLERKNVNTADYTAANWQSHPDSHTIGAQNSNATTGGQEQKKESEQQAKESEKKNEQAPPAVWRPGRGAVLINEIVSDPIDREEEWVELYNTTRQIIDFVGWTLEDGSGGVVTLSGKLDVKSGKQYAVFSVGSGFLDNAGDMIILYSAERVMIDRLTYGNWDDGDLRDNAVAAVDPFSLARIGNTLNNRDDFRMTGAPTKGAANTIVERETARVPEAPPLVISELVPNPSSRSPEDEFIELYNPNDVPVNLTGWELTLLNDIRYVFSDGKPLKPQEYRAYPRSMTGLPLRNTGGERVRLFAPNALRATDEVRYTENAPLDLSYARNATGMFEWTQTSTPNDTNVIKRDNTPPTIVIAGPYSASPGDPLTFDASDTYDRDGDPLIFHWNFGDGTTGAGPVVHHRFDDEDAFPILLTVSDGHVSMAQFHHIVIEDRISAATVTPPSFSAHANSSSPARHSVVQPPSSVTTPPIQTKSISTSLGRVRSLKSGTRVVVEGVVSMPPGIVSENYFYIAGSGIQIWNLRKEFPPLARGDKIAISGAVRKNGKETAIRIEQANNIAIIGREEDPLALETSLGEIGEALEGELVRVTGTVADTRWPNVYLEEGDARVRVYVTKNTGIAKESMPKESVMAVTGIVSETSAGYRILPRDENDIAIATPEGAILGEKVSESRVLTLPERKDPRANLLKYFIVTFIATLIIAAGLGAQFYLDRRKKK